MDEDFFAYLEDVDLNLRFNSKNRQTVYVPKAISFHQGGVTSGKMKGLRRQADIQNWWFIIIKNYPLSTIIKHGPKIFLERLRNLNGLIKETDKKKIIPEIIRVYLKTIGKILKIMKKRKPIKEAILSRQY